MNAAELEKLAGLAGWVAEHNLGEQLGEHACTVSAANLAMLVVGVLDLVTEIRRLHLLKLERRLALERLSPTPRMPEDES